MHPTIPTSGTRPNFSSLPNLPCNELCQVAMLSLLLFQISSKFLGHPKLRIYIQTLPSLLYPHIDILSHNVSSFSFLTTSLFTGNLFFFPSARLYSWYFFARYDNSNPSRTSSMMDCIRATTFSQQWILNKYIIYNLIPYPG